MAWLSLIFAGLFEVVGVMGMNRIKTRRDLRSFAILIAGFACSFVLLSYAMKTISMGTAYAIWTAIGTVGGTLIGMLIYGESREPLRIFFLGLVVCAVVGLKLIS